MQQELDFVLFHSVSGTFIQSGGLTFENSQFRKVINNNVMDIRFEIQFKCLLNTFVPKI